MGSLAMNSRRIGQGQDHPTHHPHRLPALAEGTPVEHLEPIARFPGAQAGHRLAVVLAVKRVAVGVLAYGNPPSLLEVEGLDPALDEIQNDGPTTLVGRARLAAWLASWTSYEPPLRYRALTDPQGRPSRAGQAPIIITHRKRKDEQGTRNADSLTGIRKRVTFASFGDRGLIRDRMSRRGDEGGGSWRPGRSSVRPSPFGCDRGPLI